MSRLLRSSLLLGSNRWEPERPLALSAAEAKLGVVCMLQTAIALAPEHATQHVQQVVCKQLRASSTWDGPAIAQWCAVGASACHLRPELVPYYPWSACSMHRC